MYLFLQGLAVKERNKYELKIKPFVGTDISPDNLRTLLKKMLYARYYYAISEKEWFLYGFDTKSEVDRRKYVCAHEMFTYYYSLNAKGRPEIFTNKVKTYDCFKKYYRRELIAIDTIDQEEAFYSFLKKHPLCFLKPVADFGGKGSHKIEISDSFTNEQAWSSCNGHMPFIVEELITQAQEMSEFYPLSVNTIRYNTFFHDNKLTRMQAVFRIGRGGSVVDNATAGGIYALVNTETGKILGPARSFKGELFDRHPDTGTLINGNSIPRWKELNSLLEEVVRVVPQQKQVGWDFALSPDGWVMVEGNIRPALQSFDLNHGLRDLVTETVGKVVPMWE